MFMWMLRGKIIRTALSCVHQLHTLTCTHVNSSYIYVFVRFISHLFYICASFLGSAKPLGMQTKPPGMQASIFGACPKPG